MLETLRSGQLSLGPMIDRFEARARRAGRRAVRRRRLERHRGAAPLHAPRRLGPGDEVDHLAVLVRRLGELRALRGRDAGLRRHRPGHAQPRPGRGRGGDHAADEGDPAVDIFGYPCELDGAARRSPSGTGSRIIEDACEALGAEYRGRPVGSFGHPAVFAFYPNKQMTTGEGGAVAVALGGGMARCSRASRTRAAPTRADGSTHARFGYNYRLDDLSAALGLAQVERLDEILAARVGGRRPLRRAARRRRRGRAAAARRRRPPALVVRLRRQARRAGSTASGVIARLAERGHRHRAATCPRSTCSRTCASASATARACCPVSEEASRATLALPFFTESRLPAGATRSAWSETLAGVEGG